MKLAALLTISPDNWLYLGTCLIEFGTWRKYNKSYKTVVRFRLKLYQELVNALRREGHHVVTERIHDHVSWFPPTLQA